MSLSPEQLEQRRHLITASDAAAILGLLPFKDARTAHHVFAEKVGLAPPWEGNWRTRRGEAVEPALLAWLGEKSAPLTLKPSGGTTLTHPILTWLGATPDALMYDGEQLVAVGEAKSTGYAQDWVDEYGADVVPDYYQVQLIVQMAVVRVPAARVVVEVLGEDEPRVLQYARNEDDELAILEELERFHRDHIVARVPPPMDDATYRQVAAVYRRPTSDNYTIWTEHAEREAQRYLKASAIEKRAKAEAGKAKAQLCALIAENEGIVGPTWRATWKERAAQSYVVNKPAYRHFNLGRVRAKKGTT